MTTTRVSAVLATTQPISAYGGFQASRKLLQDLAKSVQSGGMPLTLNHDGRRRVETSNVEAGVRLRPDGEWEAWAEFDVDEREWATWQAEVDASGGPGGMSFTFLYSRIEMDGDPELGLTAEVHADPAYYTSEQVVESARNLVDRTSFVRAGFVYQFSAIPDPVVLLQLGGNLLLAMPPELLGAWLYDSLKPFLRRAAETAPPDRVSTFQLKYKSTPTSREVSAYVTTQDDATLLRAMELLPEELGKAGSFDFLDGEWTQLAE